MRRRELLCFVSASSWVHAECGRRMFAELDDKNRGERVPARCVCVCVCVNKVGGSTDSSLFCWLLHPSRCQVHDERGEWQWTWRVNKVRRQKTRLQACAKRNPLKLKGDRVRLARRWSTQVSKPADSSIWPVLFCWTKRNAACKSE